MIPKNTLKAQLIIYRCLQDTISNTSVISCELQKTGRKE
jgi:hypothetical protein